MGRNSWLFSQPLASNRAAPKPLSAREQRRLDTKDRKSPKYGQIISDFLQRQGTSYDETPMRKKDYEILADIIHSLSKKGVIRASELFRELTLQYQNNLTEHPHFEERLFYREEE